MDVKDYALEYLRRVIESESWGSGGEDFLPMVTQGRFANHRPYAVVVGRTHTVIFHQVEAPVPVVSSVAIAKAHPSPLDALGDLVKFNGHATLESLLARTK